MWEREGERRREGVQSACLREKESVRKREGTGLLLLPSWHCSVFPTDVSDPADVKNSHGDFKVIQTLPIYKTRKRLSFPATWSFATLSVFTFIFYLQNMSLLCAFIFGGVSWLLYLQGSSCCIPRSFSGIGIDCTHQPS